MFITICEESKNVRASGAEAFLSCYVGSTLLKLNTEHHTLALCPLAMDQTRAARYRSAPLQSALHRFNNI